MNKFGEYFYTLRIKAGKTLRVFCNEVGVDPGNISKMERGILPPSTDDTFIEKCIDIFGLESEDEKQYFRDRIYLAKGMIPRDILNDEEKVNSLIELFKIVRGSKDK